MAREEAGPSTGDLGETLRRQRAQLRTREGEARTPEDMARAMGIGSAESIRRWESGQQWPPLSRLIAEVLPAYGLSLLEWVKLAAGQSARRVLAVLRMDRSGAETQGDSFPVHSALADGAVAIDSFGDSLIDNQELSVTWVALAPNTSTARYQNEFGRAQHSHGGEELLLVVEGEVTFYVRQRGTREQAIRLRPGDGVLLKALAEHAAHNQTDSVARYVVVWTPARPPRITLL